MHKLSPSFNSLFPCSLFRSKIFQYHLNLEGDFSFILRSDSLLVLFWTKMVRSASSPSSSPVTITVSSGGKGGGSRSMGLTSPVPRASFSNNPNSPLSGRANRARSSSGGRYVSMSKDDATEEISSEFVTYTVHIPPTPDHQPMSASQTSLNEDTKSEVKPERSFISGTIFTGGV